jgi:long-chain acyl-CoA synthetase
MVPRNSAIQENSHVLDYYRQAARDRPSQKAFFVSAPGFHVSFTYHQIWNMALSEAMRLRDWGIKSGDRVAIWAQSSWRWEIAQLAIFLNHAVVVGLDPNEAAKNLPLIHQVTQLKLILYENDFFKERWKTSGAPEVGMLLLSSSFTHEFEFLEVASRPDLECLIIFTSGTTSQPKAISYTGQQLVLAVEAILSNYPEVKEGLRTVCWLPLSNLFQRVLNFSTVAFGGEIYFVENPTEIIGLIKGIAPTVFISVPRFYEKIYDSIMGKLAASPIVIRQFLFLGLWLLQLRWRIRKYTFLHSLFGILLLPWKTLLFKKIREVFGSRIKFLISGSAAMRIEILRFFHAIGLPIFEAYGSSESIIPIAMNTSSMFRLGSVGKPVTAGKVIISNLGEVLVKGPGVFRGYLQSQVAASFTDDQFYKTGDRGHFDQDGFLYLEGRVTESFKTSAGKKVAIQEIESAFKKLTFIDQAVVLGEGRKAPLIFLTLDLPLLASYFRISLDRIWSIESGLIDPIYLNQVEQAVRTIFRKLDLPVKPAGTLILTRRFSLEKGEITPNLKIRRQIIESDYKSHLDEVALEAEKEKDFAVRFLSSEGAWTPGNENFSVRGRLWALTKVMTKIGFAQVQMSLNLISKQELNTQIGQLLRVGLGGLRGPMQKLGQMLSMMPETLPIEIKDELQRLFRESHPVNSSLIRSIVEKELAKPIPGIFSEWHDHPIATGSVGQVHWARLTSGEEVAVKVLIPGIESALKSDLRILKFAIPLLKKLLNFHDLPGHFEELSAMMMKEADLRNEAHNGEVFRKIFANDPRFVIPKVYSHLSTEKILITDFIQGQSLEDVIKEDDQNRKNYLAELIWISACRSINVHAFFNADPHPGNFIVIGDKIALIDFGFCKIWDTGFITQWKKQVLASCLSDFNGFEQASRNLGVVNDRDPSFYAKLQKANEEVIYQPWLLNEEFHFTAQWQQKYLKSLLEHQIMVPGLKMPSEFLPLSRLYWGKFSLMVMLNAKANFHHLTMPYIRAETLGIENLHRLGDAE